ncbi:hypothetical protein QZH41_002092 [Actinostola sp. cb2023]|nr:hypothetical protein QZH41_002092 [Actinostola sp. cb2023]
MICDHSVAVAEHELRLQQFLAIVRKRKNLPDPHELIANNLSTSAGKKTTPKRKGKANSSRPPLMPISERSGRPASSSKSFAAAALLSLSKGTPETSNNEEKFSLKQLAGTQLLRRLWSPSSSNIVRKMLLFLRISHHIASFTALLRVQSDIFMSMDRQEITLLVLLDLSAAFDTIDHEIMLEVLQSDFGVIGDALKWMKSFLSGRKQHVVINDQSSKAFNMDCGVPQGSCLGPVLFLLYAARLFEVVKKHLPSVHGYADDSQLYFSFRPDSLASQDQAVQVVENCIADMRAWLVHNKLMFNDKKTEFLIIGSRQQLAKVSIKSIQIGDSDIPPVKSLRNLGSWFDNRMTMGTHVGKVCSKAFRGLYNIRQIRKFLSADSTKTLVHAFVTSHVDYCNSLLSGLPQYQYDRIQKVFNAAARVTCLTPRYDHITPVLFHLHWLPVKYRVDFKLALLVYKAFHGMAPEYICELLQLKPPSRHSLRSD